MRSPLTLRSQVAGIPCQIKVTHYLRVPPWKGSVYTCPSDMDWRGFTECEFDVLDLRGRPAAWLDKKLTDADRERIEGEVGEAMREEAEA